MQYLSWKHAEEILMAELFQSCMVGPDRHWNFNEIIVFETVCDYVNSIGLT